MMETLLHSFLHYMEDEMEIKKEDGRFQRPSLMRVFCFVFLKYYCHKNV